MGELDGQRLALAFTIDRHGDQYRLADNDPRLANRLVSGVDDEMERWFGQATARQRP